MNLETNLPTFIVQTCKGRESYINYLNLNINNLIVNYDDFISDNDIITSVWKNYLRGWKLVGNNATVQMDDDIVLCKDFYNKILNEISKRPNDIIQFFSMRKNDIIIGSRYEAGSKFLMQQCYYLPKGLANELYIFAKEYEKTMNEKGCPTDIVMAQFFKQNKLKYWIVIPNLVNHRIGISMIDKRRSSTRQSLTYEQNL